MVWEPRSGFYIALKFEQEDQIMAVGEAAPPSGGSAPGTLDPKPFKWEGEGRKQHKGAKARRAKAQPQALRSWDHMGGVLLSAKGLLDMAEKTGASRLQAKGSRVKGVLSPHKDLGPEAQPRCSLPIITPRHGRKDNKVGP